MKTINHPNANKHALHKDSPLQEQKGATSLFLQLPGQLSGVRRSFKGCSEGGMGKLVPEGAWSYPGIDYLSMRENEDMVFSTYIVKAFVLLKIMI